MATDQENVSRILVVLSHPLRREILLTLSEKGECSFTDFMNALHVDTGKLSFHIRNLDGFLEQTPAGKYRLTRAGENAIRLVKDLEAWAVEVDVAKKGSMLPLAPFKKRVLAFLIDFAMVFAIFWVLPAVFSFFTKGLTSVFDINVILFFVILLWIYFTLLEGFAGQSLGKRLIGLMVVRVDGKRLFYDHAAVRNFSKGFFLLLPFDLLIGLRLKDPKFVRYLDKFAGTTVKDLRS
jgi:uncharacterized RDD family membrane protein YckC/DNA-binding HxlR family transcriptional regulator